MSNVIHLVGSVDGMISVELATAYAEQAYERGKIVAYNDSLFINSVVLPDNREFSFRSRLGMAEGILTAAEETVANILKARRNKA